MNSTAPSRLLTVCAALSIALLARPAAAADTVVQIPVDSVIDGRTVSTATGGTITPWSAGQGVDGDGGGDGYVTDAAEAILVTQNKTVGGKAGKALPDDGMFPADTRHPAIALHFSNAAPLTSPQTHQIYINATRGAQMFQFNVPQATYSKMFLFITASEGGAALTITLNYAGGAAPTVQKLMLPDYGIGGAKAGDAVFFNLIEGMRKWSGTDNEGDSTTHTITGIELNPTATAMLTSIQVAKTNGSHCVFWGATGIATSAVTTGGGGSGAPAARTAARRGPGARPTGARQARAPAARRARAARPAPRAAARAGTTSTGTAGTTGAAGMTGAGTAGTSGGTSGAAGTTATTGTAGTAGNTTGAAGTSGPKHSSGGGGCALAGSSRGGATWLLLAAALALVVARRRK